MAEIAIGLPTLGGPYNATIKGHGIIRNNTVPLVAIVTNNYEGRYTTNIAKPIVVATEQSAERTLHKQTSTLIGKGTSSTYDKPRFKGLSVNFYGMTVKETRLIRDWTSFEQKTYNHVNPAHWEDRGYVTGIVTLKNTIPLVRLLRLYHRDTGRLIDSTWSTVSGTYRFAASISLTDPYYVVCLNDGETDYNTILHDWVVPDQI